MTRLLVVTADDLGLTDGVNRAVERGYRDGVVTATSLLAVGAAFDNAAAMLHRNPGLELGAHLAIVGEDPPLLPPAQIPSLVGRGGRFPLSYRTVVARAAARRLDPDDVRREFTAQLERVLTIGLPVSHLDTHQHVHLWPSIGAVVADLAVAHHIPVLRAPRSHRARPVGAGVNLLAGRLRSLIDRRGLLRTDDYRGLDEAGRLDTATFAAAVAAPSAAPDTGRHGGSLEINCHPGEAGDDTLNRFDWDYRWAEELAMLTDARSRAAVTEGGFRLGGFAELGSRPGGAS